MHVERTILITKVEIINLTKNDKSVNKEYSILPLFHGFHVTVS